MKSAAPSADAILRRGGLRRTPVRRQVLNLLRRSGRALGAPEILGRLKGVDSVTVYRTLNRFVAKGMVHRVRGEDRTWQYALNDDSETRHRHPHFVCDACGTVRCMQEMLIPQRFMRSFAATGAYAVSYPEVLLHGLCPKCH